MGKLSGQVALVTGAGQGVGQGIALALAAEGAAVAVVGRTLAKCEVTVKQIEQRGGRALAVRADVCSADDITRSVDETVRALGGLQILVNNAQVVPLGKLLDVTDASFAEGWASGPQATHRYMRAAHPHLKKRGGVIINLGTAAALRHDPIGYGCYGAVKEAIRTLTRAAAVEWGADGIRAVNILPLAESPGFAGWKAARPDEYAEYCRSIPVGRVGDC
ncbi:MAG TPA: SDR family NAD(P)-dependent oxidoreductase, partial [Myxococcota bacterium]|nr:SDR family NAD(P)-dependent oxidoreductase [Myxococcota bacterium]